MKAKKKHLTVMFFVMLYKVVLTLESVDKVIKVTSQMKATEQYFPGFFFK